MLIVAVGWLFVVGLFALVHALSPRGSLAGALLALLLGGVLPLAVLGHLMAAGARRRARQQAASAGADPHQRGHAPGDAVAAEREEA